MCVDVYIYICYLYCTCPSRMWNMCEIRAIGRFCLTRISIPYENKLMFVTPFNILFRGGGRCWFLMKISWCYFLFNMLFEGMADFDSSWKQVYVNTPFNIIVQTFCMTKHTKSDVLLGGRTSGLDGTCMYIYMYMCLSHCTYYVQCIVWRGWRVWSISKIQQVEVNIPLNAGYRPDACGGYCPLWRFILKLLSDSIYYGSEGMAELDNLKLISRSEGVVDLIPSEDKKVWN